VLEERKVGKTLVIKGFMVGSDAHIMTMLISILDHIAASVLSPTLYVSRLSPDVVGNGYVQETSLETDVWYKLCNRRTLTRQPLTYIVSQKSNLINRNRTSKRNIDSEWL
jgi:hypothetical protein